MKIIPSSMESVNKLIKGYDNETTFGIFANSMEGKSMFMLQEAFHLASKLKKNILYIDSEADMGRYFMEWSEPFSKRFNVSPKSVMRVKKIGYNKLLDYHGIKLSDKTSNSGKVTTTKLKESSLEKSKIYEHIFKNKIGVIMYDSVTTPFEVFGSATFNLPSRGDVLCFLYNRIAELMDECGVYVLFSHKLSENPTEVSGYGDGKMKGGIANYYHTKIILRLQGFKTSKFKKEKRALLEKYRMLFLYRYPNKKKLSQAEFLKITDDGLIDIEKSEVCDIIGDKNWSVIHEESD